MSMVEAQQVLYDVYETNYGIYHHPGSTVRKPWASVAMHECEDNTKGTLLYEAIAKFSMLGIGEMFHMSLHQYLSLPSDLCLHIVELASRKINRTAQVTAEIDRQAAAAAADAKKQ